MVRLPPLPKGIELSLAVTRDDLEAAYRLLHDVYTEIGFMEHHPSGLRLNVYNMLPHTSTVVAKIDGKVEITEVNKLHEEREKIWRKTDDEKHEFDTDGVIETEAIFEWLDEEGYSSEDALNEFKEYALEHAAHFDPLTHDNIMHTCKEIATQIRKINHAESNLLHDIESFLNKLKHHAKR